MRVGQLSRLSKLSWLLRIALEIAFLVDLEADLRSIFNRPSPFLSSALAFALTFPLTIIAFVSEPSAFPPPGISFLAHLGFAHRLP